MLVCVCAFAWTGCGVLRSDPAPLLADGAARNRRLTLWDTSQQPSSVPHIDVDEVRPDEAEEEAEDVYQLNAEAIVRLMYQQSPWVISPRENMIAARYGLTEFRTNLSRFEPYAKINADWSDYPERDDSRAVSGEFVGGLEKETFEGAIFRVEGGVSGSRVTYHEVEDDEDPVEEGGGAVVRARVEVPFVGSRKRTTRIINQAFQESSARKAMLNYLTNFRSYTKYALNYYRYSIRALHYMRAYETKIQELESLLAHPQLTPSDRLRVEASLGDARVLRDQHEASYWAYLLLVLQYLGIEPEESYVLVEPPLKGSRYLDMVRTDEGMETLAREAYANNPRFQVLRDAIRNAELQRSQAIVGDYDITAFLQGTQFPFGAASYDDRLGGWLVSAGVTVRVNDQRVLSATRAKAESEIREYRSEIEAEVLAQQRQIATEAQEMRAYHDAREQIIENLEIAREEYIERRDRFLDTQPEGLTIDDVTGALSTWISTKIRLAGNVFNASRSEDTMLSATGDMYQIVGLRIIETDEGMELAEPPAEVMSQGEAEVSDQKVVFDRQTDASRPR